MLVSTATQTLDTRATSANSSAAVSAVSSKGTSGGKCTSAPIESRSACPGGYFDATAGTTSTCGCSKNSGIGGRGAVHRPCAKICAWSRYELSSCTVATGTTWPQTYHTTATLTSAKTSGP